ncbi:hypothetical protein HY029_06115 [Candidatus Gottesmanbacteria bacterium]|nr:hypothetical protein [Candidatus Gottesmanbacteria bacterium]
MRNTQLNIKLVIFTVIAGKLKIFLSNDKLLVGSLITGKSLNQSAEILFKEKVGILLKDIYIEQLYTFSSIKPLEISVVYYFLVPEHKIYSNKYNWKELATFILNKSDKKIILYAVQRLRWKIEYTNVVYSLLPDEFTFGQLQSIYEAILGKTLDKRNFRKKILILNILKSTGHIKNLGKARPAEMFSFTKKKLSFVQIL